jgi:hypothetical protein
LCGGTQRQAGYNNNCILVPLLPDATAMGET